MRVSNVNAKGHVTFKGTVSKDNAPHYITFPGHEAVYKQFEGKVLTQLDTATHLNLTSSTYNTNMGRRQEHYVTVTNHGDTIASKSYIGAWGADENPRSGWDFLSWLPGRLGQWAENKGKQEIYAAQLDRALKIAQKAETAHIRGRQGVLDLISV